MIILIDTGIVGLLTQPNSTNESTQILDWMYNSLAKSVRVLASDICDYEIRRGLIKARLDGRCSDGIEKLDQLREVIEFLPITNRALAHACVYWADAAKKSQLNAPKHDINFDLILCGTWKVLTEDYPGQDIVIATKNLRDFLRFANADLWQNI